MSTGCKVCDDKVACRVIDEELEKGMSFEATARLMTLRGFSVSSPTIANHNKHRAPSARHDIVKTKRDLAIIIRDKVADRLEADEEFDVFGKDVGPGLNAGLKAQGLIDKRETRKVTQNFWLNLYTGQQGEVLAIEDGTTVEGEAVEVG